MKTRMKHLVWATMIAAGLSAGIATTRAQNKDTTESTSSRALSPTSNDRTLGKVEKANKLIGQEVRNTSDQKIGKIDDLVVDLESGRVLYAVVSVGGFLGVGDRLAAVPPGAFRERADHWQLDADKQKLTSAPQFSSSRDKEAEMASPSFVSGVYRYFGQNAWWEGASASTGSSSRFGNAHRVSDLIGMDVQNSSNQKLSDVDNVMIDLPAARVVYIILTPERSLGLKNNLYALPPNALTLSSDKKTLTTGIDRDKLASAPSFDKSEWPDLSNPSWASRVYQYYGKQAYFENGSLRPTSERTNSQDRIYHETIQPQK